MSVTLEHLLADSTETTRNSTTGALDNTKRTRAGNRTLEDLQDYADWDFTRRTKAFQFIDGLNEYSLQNYLGATCLDNDGSTSIGDFKNPYDLRIPGISHRPFAFHDAKDVRRNIRDGRSINEYAVDGDLLIVNYPRQVSAEIHDCDSLTAGGVWTASGDATNLTIDEVEYEEGSGALNFDVAAGTSLVLTLALTAAKDLSEFENKSHWTLQVDLPTITNFSSVAIEFSDVSNFATKWTITKTAPADGQAIAVGRQLFAFAWADATQTGSPDASAVQYVRVTITYSVAVTDTDFRLDDLRIGQTLEMELEYYSLAMVKDEDGNYQLEFNPDEVTMNDELLGGVTARRTVVAGMTHELFNIIGGKSERDRTDSEKKYEAKKKELCQKCGRRLRRPSKVLNFPGRR